MASKANINKIHVPAKSLGKARKILDTALLTGNYTLTEKKGEYFLTLNQDDAFFSSKNKAKQLRLSDLEKLAKTHDVPLTKRIYRKKEDRPDPTLDPGAEFNRMGKRLHVRLDPDVLEEVKEAASKADLTVTAWIAEAIHLKLTVEK